MSSEPKSVGQEMPAFLSRFFAAADRLEQRRLEAAADIAKAEAEIREQAEQRLRAGAAAHLEACGVDAATAKIAAAPTLKTSALEAVARWLEGSRPVLVFTGGYGSGKSVAAASTLLHARRWTRTMAHPLADEPVAFQEYDHRRGLFVSAARLHFAPRFVDGKEVPLIARACDADWLVLDELRAEDTKGAGLGRLEEVLGLRCAENRRTVITTNEAPADIGEIVGGKLASRFAEFAVVVGTGKTDLRRRPS